MSPFTYKSLGALDRVGEGMKRESKARHSVWHPVWPINSYCYCCYCYCSGGRSPWEEPDAGPSAWAPSSAPTGPVIPSCAPAHRTARASRNVPGRCVPRHPIPAPGQLPSTLPLALPAIQRPFRSQPAPLPQPPPLLSPASPGIHLCQPLPQSPRFFVPTASL